MAGTSQSESTDLIRGLAKGYAELVLVLVGLAPAVAIAYLYFFQDPTLRFEHHSVHEIAIGISLLQSGFVAFVAWRCYLHAGEPFLRWLTLGFLAFTIVYSLHGVFTRISHDNLSLFILYGPAARFALAVCLLAGLSTQGQPPHLVAQRSRRRYWVAGLGVFVVIQAFLTTGSFTTVFSQAELMERIRMEKIRAEDALLELQRAHEELETLAATDLLTGATSRREFEARASAEVARAKRSGAPLSFVAIDLDHFKEINDQHGHRTGDEVLKAFVALVRKDMRPSDLIGRLGGEEFAMMLPDTTRDVATVVAERLRQRVASETVTIAGAHLQFTASLGVAQYGLDGDGYDSVIDIADSRMYRAKQLGRNQVVAD